MVQISIKQVLINFMKENKASIFGYLFFSLAVPISNIYLPHLYGKIISLINKKGTIDKQVLVRFSAIFVIWVIVQLFWMAMNVIDSNFIPKLRSHVRKYIVDVVLDTYKQDYVEDELGGIIAEIVRLPDEVDHMFNNIRNHFLPISFMIIFSIGYFTWVNPLIGAASIVAITIYLSIAFKFSMRCMSTCTEMNSSHRVLHDEINDCLGNLLNIYTSNQDKQEQERLDQYETKFKDKHRKTIRCAGNFRLLLNLSYIFLFCAINILSFVLFSKKMMPLSSVVSILIISLELISKMAGFIGSVDRMMFEVTIIKDVQKSLDTLNSRTQSQSHVQDEKQHHEPCINLNGNIEFSNFNLFYNGNHILKDINLTFYKHQTTVIMGEIGSGKTSLVNAIIKLVPYNGKIIINGVDIANLSLDCVRDQILYVPQNPRLFNRSIYENISYGNGVDKGRVKDVLLKYGLNIDLDRSVGKFGQSLSGGQRQIVYLLRCLFKKAPIIILDEPTASLDSNTKDKLFSILSDLLKERTVLIISHDPEVLRYANRRIILDKGVVIQS